MLSLNNIRFRAVIYILIFTVTTIVVVTVFLSSLRLSTLSTTLNPYLSSYLNITFPESFGFFTKSPKDRRIKLFNIDRKELKEIDLRANTANNLFGWKRNNRRITYELGVILRQIPDSIWTETNSNKIKSNRYTDNLFISIDSKDSDLIGIKKGDYLIFHYEPIPWELNKYQKVNKGEVAYVKIQ